MVNGDHERLDAAAQADIAGEDQLFSTQNDGRDHDEVENLPTQIVAPRELQVLLRFIPADATDTVPPREVRLQLPLESESECKINLGRLNKTEQHSSNYNQLVRLYDPRRPADKQIISREHSQLQIRRTAPGCFMVLNKDTKDHDRRRTVITSTTGESRLVTHHEFAVLSHGDVIHLTPLGAPRPNHTRNFQLPAGI